MDVMVLQTQQFLNSTYGDDPRYNVIEENGKTGWTTIYALLRAFQIQLGIKETADNFGNATEDAFKKYFPDGIIQQEDNAEYESNVYAIIQGALWCKGYSTGASTITKHFYDGTGSAIREMMTDAGFYNPNSTVTLPVMKALLSMDTFKCLYDYGGTPEVRAIQQMLNRKYTRYIGIMPCDGVYGRNTNKAMIYALQAEEKLPIDVANGNFGNTTRACCPTIPYSGAETSYYDTQYTSNDIESFIKLAQAALYFNGFGSSSITGVYDDNMRYAVLQFKEHYALPVSTTIDLSTWLSLLISSGDVNRSAKACDCATILTAAKAKTLKDNGYDVVGRYLTGTYNGGISKALTKDEIEIIFDAGMRFFPIFQTSGTYISYFNKEQGKSDAKDAVKKAYDLNLPTTAIIYFAVDCDATDIQITNNIIPHFRAIKNYFTINTYGDFRIGIYGTRNVCTRVTEAGYAVSSFVSDMSTGFSGNLGFKLPGNWAFDQFTTITIGSGEGQIEIDKDGYSGRDIGVDHILEDYYPTWDTGVGSGHLMVNKGNSPIKVFKEYGPTDGSEDMRPIDQFDEIPVDGCFAFKYNTDKDYRNHVYRAVFTDKNGNQAEGYVFKGYDYTAGDEEYLEAWHGLRDFLDYKVDPQTLQLVSNEKYKFTYNGQDCTPFTLAYNTQYYTGTDYAGILYPGTEIAIAENADTGSTMPWRIYVNLIKKNGTWEKFDKWVNLRFEKGNMPENRLLR